MTNLKKLAQSAVAEAGGPSLVAKEIRRTRQAVEDWSRVPAEHVQALAKLSGIPPEKIRPDVFKAA